MFNTKMNIETLWDVLSKKHPIEEVRNNNYSNYIIRIKPGKIRVKVGDYGSEITNQYDRTYASSFSDIVCISKHFVKKPIYTINIKDIYNVYHLIKTTNDHTCAVYTKEYIDYKENKRQDYNEIINFKCAKELVIGDKVPCLREPEKGKYHNYTCDVIGEVISIEEDLNNNGTWVYDLEVSSGKHVYYANGVLVHNSQFVNLSPITQYQCKKAKLPDNTRFSELPDNIKENIIHEAYHILDLVNGNVEQLINNNCYTTQGNVLHYALEYIASEGFYFKKKHYIVHKIISDDKPCDKFKYSGISVKKAEIPVSMKTFLKDIYESTMKSHWNESDYLKSATEAYNKFITLDWEDISFYKKLRTPKAVVSLTKSEKGAGAHARAANFYNGMLKELNLGGKYPIIDVGDEMRYSYILPNNEYGQDVLGFKNTFPEEFRDLFIPDYNKMFEKIFTKSLENYTNLMQYSKFDPLRIIETPLIDIF